MTIVAFKDDGAISAGYSQAVLCGLTAECTDNTLIVVSVVVGQIAQNIDLQDWYAPQGYFPPYPLQ